jgi:hypothetical protein
MHEKLQGLKEQGKLIKKENEGKKKLELAYISNDNFFCEQVKVIVFSNTSERAAPYIRQATKQYWDYAVFAMVLWQEQSNTFWETKLFVCTSTFCFAFLYCTLHNLVDHRSLRNLFLLFLHKVHHLQHVQLQTYLVCTEKLINIW